MGIHFTPDQQKVIDLHNRNILVSAAAGSGKTAVLVERIIRMVCDEENPVDIDRLLIVTFTNAAAAEMRERISLGIAAKLEEFPDSEHIEKQAALLHNAQITTIDSFCLYIIKNHFNEIGLDPAFRVADEGEIKLLKQDVLADLLEEHFAEKEEAFFRCVEFFCPGGKEKNLEELIFKIHQYADSNPWPEEWLQACKQDYDITTTEAFENTNLGRYILGYMQKMLGSCIATMEQISRLCEEADGPYMYGEMVEQEQEMLSRLRSCSTLSDWETGLETIAFGRLPGKKDSSVNEDKKELAKELRSRVKDSLKAMKEQFFTSLLSQSVEQIGRCREPMTVLLDLTLAFGRRMREAKQERKLLDFSDMEHYALDILLEKENGEIRPGKVALEYRQFFKEILIDEYQDSNLVQEYLLLAISGEDEGQYNRFMVGDVKQSIYKFRLARPELFLEKYKTYKSENGNCQRIDLSQNFRSRETVVNTVNHIFEKLMCEEIGGITYDDKAALHAGAVYPENPDSFSELLIINKPDKESDLDGKEAEGHLIAARIRELKQNYLVTDKETGQLRPVQYKDMVILLRATSGWDDTFKKILEQEGIPVYITSKTGYFAATEVQELLQFLRVLDNPRQDIPLFGVMKSVFGKFTEEEIAGIRSRDKKASLWEVVTGRAKDGDEKCAAFTERIGRYRDYAVYMPIRELLQTMIEDYNYLPYVTALPSGSKRKANVEMLLNKASDFEKTSYFGLFHFVRYIEQLEKYDVDYGQEELLDESADVVRIMSIHKSKGLEFPVTIVAGLAKRFNMMDVNKSFLMDMDLGVGTDYVNAESRYRMKSLRRVGIGMKLKEETLAEELRVLYVALTRAKEKLIMTASMGKVREKWNRRDPVKKGQISFERFMNAGSYMDFILPVLEEEQVKVQLYTEEDLHITRMQEQVLLMEKERALVSAKTADVDTLQKLREVFDYRYAHANLQKLYTKTTVSELKIAAMADKDEAAFHQFEEPEPEAIIPTFIRQKEDTISATTRGNAYHKVMELLDYNRLFTCKQEEQETVLKESLKEYVQSGILLKEYFEAVQIRKLMVFLQDPLARRMWHAQLNHSLYREQPFVLGISADRLGQDFPQEETVLIQGIIDAFFVEEGKIVLLDYKTDRVHSPGELWDRYETQLDYYEEALQKLMQMPVKERLLYSFSLGKCVSKIEE